MLKVATAEFDVLDMAVIFDWWPVSESFAGKAGARPQHYIGGRQARSIGIALDATELILSGYFFADR